MVAARMLPFSASRRVSLLAVAILLASVLVLAQPSVQLHVPTTAQVGQSVTLDGSDSSVSSGNIRSWVYETGDGGAISGLRDVQPVSWVYRGIGTYIVSLTATDNRKRSSTAYRLISVEQTTLQAPQTSPRLGSGEPSLIKPGEAIHFTFPEAALTAEQISRFEASWDSGAWTSLGIPSNSYTFSVGTRAYIISPPFSTGQHTLSLRACNAAGCGPATTPVFAFTFDADPPPGGDYFTGTTRTAATCSHANVSTQVAASTHGDIVQIPAGDCTWSSTLNVTVGIWLRGTGNTTIIRDSVTGTLISMAVNNPNKTRVSAMQIIGSGEQFYPNAHVLFGGTQTQFRAHDLNFNPYGKPAVATTGAALGLIDNNSFTSALVGATIFIAHPTLGGSSAYGDGSWATTITWGGADQVYIEDNTATKSSGGVGQFTDSMFGGRFVVRYNTLTRRNIGSHGTDSGQRVRGVRQMEVYHNTFTAPGDTLDFFTWIRSGSGVVFNNSVSSTWTNSYVKTTNCRSNDCGMPAGGWPPWGACNGSSPYDQNQAGMNGYRCVDQPGAGTSNNLNSAVTPTAQWVGNVLEPIYEWGNTGQATARVSGHGSVVVSGRDFYANTQKPGYTAYTYPHPLRSTN